MKKTVLLAFLLMLLLVSCKEEPDFREVQVSDDVALSQTVTPNELDKETDFKAILPLYRNSLGQSQEKYDDMIWQMSVENRLIHFLDALVYQNVELVNVYTNGWGHDYSGVAMTYELGETEAAEWDGCKAVVKIKVTKSDNATFPVGEHEYEITSNYMPDPAFISIKKVGQELNDNLPESDDPKLKDALVFSDRYLDWCMYETKDAPDIDKLFELIKLDVYENLVIRLDGFTLADFEKYMLDRFGAEQGSYPEITEKLQRYYDVEKEKYVYSYGQCATTYACRITGVDKTDKGYNINYEFYSDMAYLQKCMDVTLVFEENENTDIMRLVNVERNAIINVPRASYNA